MPNVISTSTLPVRHMLSVLPSITTTSRSVRQAKVQAQDECKNTRDRNADDKAPPLEFPRSSRVLNALV